MKDYKDILLKYLPTGSVDRIMDLLLLYKVNLRITKSRNTKCGDYKPPVDSDIHKISVNHDLNKYAFLITLIHELAHLVVWMKYGNRAKPHGREWKYSFRMLMDSIIKDNIFPDDITAALNNYLKNAKASSSSDLGLTKILKNYDDKKYMTLENLPNGAVFKIKNGKTFKKLQKMRKRYRCLCLNNKKMYFVNPMVEVIPVNE